MRITRKHKLYFQGENQELRRLDKFFPELYVHVLKSFLEGEYNNEYAEQNKKVEVWQDWKPLKKWVPEELVVDFKKKFNANEMTFSYNGHWKPLITLTIEPKKF